MTVLQRIGARCRQSRGQALILTVVAMSVMLGSSGMAIDAATWYQKHHKEQVAADAASLAGANCLAHPDTGPSVECSSTSDCTDAETVAINIAANDGLAITDGDIDCNTSKDTVSVTVPGTSSSFFANLFGIHTATSSANSVASFSQATTNYRTMTNATTNGYPETESTTITNTSSSSIGGSALAIFAKDSTCSHNGVDMTGNSSFIDGGVFSNSSIMVDPPTTFDGSVDYGPTKSGCAVNINGGGQTTYDDGNPVSTNGLANWPVSWAGNEPACTVTWSGSGTPPVGSASGGTWDIPNGSNAVYCYSGAILLNGQKYSDVTFECGSFDVNSGSVTVDGDSTTSLLVYATDSGDAVTLGGGSDSYLGEMETPSGDIDITSGSNNISGLLEGQDVILGAGSENITGSGPTTYGSSTSTTTTASTWTTTTYSTTENETTTSTTTAGNDGLSQ